MLDPPQVKPEIAALLLHRKLGTLLIGGWKGAVAPAVRTMGTILAE
jgi:hypothetical protein